MMEGKAGVSMESRKKMSRAKSNSPMKRTVRRAVAWLLVFCMCMANMNSAVYAAEIATSSDALMAATPSDAAATDSNAAEILMPEETVSGEELKEEAIRAISAGHEFDFDSEIRVVKDAEGKNESYSELFKGYRSFTLFADNGNGGRLTGGNDNAYGYIVVRVDKDAYETFEKEEGTARATDSDATDSSAAERVWSLTGDEELIFLYVNADNGTVTFSLNIENLEADDIVVPSRAELYEDTEEEAEETSPAEKPAEDANEAGGSGSGGGSGSSSGSSGDVQDDPTDEGASDDSQAEDGQTDDSQNENDSENDTDAEKPDEKPEDGQTGGGSDSGQENNDSSNTDKEDGNTDSGSDSNSGSGSENAGDSGNSDSNSGSDSGKDEGGSSDKGDSSDKGGSDSDSAKLSKSSLSLPTVMGPNPNAEFEEDEFGDMSFDEWQEMMEEEEEEAEEDEEDYTEEVPVAYDSEDEGISYLNMTMLPAVGAVVKKTEQAKGFAKLFKSSRSGEAEAVVMAGSISLKALDGITVKSAYKQIEELEDGNYRLHLGLSGGGDSKGFDVVLVVDESTSMNKDADGDSPGFYGTSRLDMLKTALNGTSSWGNHQPGFVENIASKYPGSRFTVVPYGSGSSADGLEGSCGWTQSVDSVKNAVKKLEANASDTNYEEGLWSAKEAIEKRSESSNALVVVFLTDGVPTNYTNQRDAFDTGRVSDEYDKGLEYPNKDTALGTMAAAYEFKSYLEQSNGSMFVVGFGVPNRIGDNKTQKNKYKSYKGFTPEQYLYALSGSVDRIKEGSYYQEPEYKVDTADHGNVISVDSGSMANGGLTDALNRISESLKMTNVVINDRLSKYIEFLGIDGDPTTATDAKVVKIKNGVAAPADYESLSFLPPDEKNSTWGIELRFGEDVELDPEATYELQFTVKKNVEAFAGEIPAEDIVPGDADTNYKGTDISSPDKTGVRTNSKATYSYGTIRPQEYPHPIIPASATYTPGHQKYIKDNGDGTYDLTLTVKSDKGSEIIGGKDPIPADIMFVIDKSGSMNDKIAGTTKRKIINDCLNDLIITVSNGDTDVQYAGYKFSDKDEALRVDFKEGWNEKSTYWTGETQKAISKLQLTDSQTSGPTYPSYALGQAIEKLETGSHLETNRKKYLIFFTDGAPGQNTDDISEKEMTRCYSAIEKLDSDATFYAIRVGYEDTRYRFMEKMVSNAGTEDAHLYSGMDKESIKAAFQQIADDIAGQIGTQTTGVTNAVISDKLSAYADMVEDSEIVVTRDGEVLTEGSDYTKTYNADTKTVEVRFNGELVQHAVYEVTFKVKPSQAAKDAYQQDGGYYRNPDGSQTENVFTGADGTDAPGNTTSSGQPGFPSNEKAVLSWQYDGAAGKTEYDHPVLQVPQTGQFVVQKLVEIDDNETPLADAKFIINLDKADENGNYTEFSSVALKADGTSSPAVKTEGEAQFKISEAVPMEYSLTGIEVFQKAASGELSNVTDTRLQNDILTVQPGDDLIVKVTNNLAHEGYFHSTDQVTNWTNGNPETPFTSDKSAAREAAESQPKADAGKKNKKVTEMEEEEGDPLV